MFKFLRQQIPSKMLRENWYNCIALKLTWLLASYSLALISVCLLFYRIDFALLVSYNSPTLRRSDVTWKKLGTVLVVAFLPAMHNLKQQSKKKESLQLLKFFWVKEIIEKKEQLWHTHPSHLNHSQELSGSYYSLEPSIPRTCTKCASCRPADIRTIRDLVALFALFCLFPFVQELRELRLSIT